LPGLFRKPFLLSNDNAAVIKYAGFEEKNGVLYIDTLHNSERVKLYHGSKSTDHTLNDNLSY
jgi:hypothetical protein